MSKTRIILRFRHYIYIFLIVSISTFMISGWYVYSKISNINQDFQRAADNEAYMEVHSVVRDTLNHLRNLATDITTLDEIHLQLNNPGYYGYWKEHRATSLGFPAYVKDIDLYNSNKEILGNIATNDTEKTITFIDGYFYINNSHLYYIESLPILSRNNSTAIDGYLLVKTDIIQALVASSKLLVTDKSSIQTKNSGSKMIPPDEFMNHLEFSASQNPLFDELLNTTQLTLIYGFVLFLLFTLALFHIARSMINDPLSRLTNHVEQLKLGTSTDTDNLSFSIYEFNQLKESIDDYQQELTLIHNNLDRKNDELWKLAHRDSLTGAANRRAYEEDWQSYLSIADHQRFYFSYMLIDCDHFKAINDTYGHDTGDKLIIRLVEIFNKSLREGDKLYRIGGDEFATILWNTDSVTSDKIAQRCIDNIRMHSFDSLGIHEPVTISIGIATHTKDTADSLSALPRQADLAMYHAKRSGSRSIIHYQQNMESDLAPLVSNRVIDAVIRAANNNEGIEIHYQPVVNSNTLKIAYYEALLRIRDKQGLIGAGDIFPVAEKLSLEAEIDLAVLASIEHDLKHKLLPARTGVSINFSAALFSIPDLTSHLQTLVQYLSDYTIIFEVTEKTMITDLEMVSIKLHDLRRKGFQIALDDFGSGYSSIRYLANMPIDIVKFDISMTQQLAIEDKKRSIISGTAGVILKSGFKLVAEGIETSELQELVIRMGATHMQGYGLGKPAPIDAILKN